MQPYSCTSANFAVCVGILLRSDRIMGLDTPCGGKTSHGYYLPNGRKVSGASIFFGSLPYKVDPQTGYINIEKLQERALEFRPKILICGGSSYPREWDCAKFRKIADMSGAVLLCDMAQISGLIATKECESPLHLCNIVTSTTHKSLRGPRGGIIFYRKGSKPRKRGILLNQGRNFKRVCESCHNTVNKVTVSSKAGTITGVDVRIGTPAMTSRGCLGADMAIIADFLLGAAQIARDVQREHGNRKSFLNGLENNKDIVELRSRVKSFASQYALPGCEI